MYVTSGRDVDVRLTLEAVVDLVNASRAGTEDTRALLERHSFTRAQTAPESEVDTLNTRFGKLIDRLDSLPEAAGDNTIEWVNTEIARLPIAPSMVEHDGGPLHIHWTPRSATFDNQVIADMLMALALELCDHGTRRFGRCAAAGCENLFYDATRNGSRRFCADPRCASRTHTAQHRARHRTGA